LRKGRGKKKAKGNENGILNPTSAHLLRSGFEDEGYVFSKARPSEENGKEEGRMGEEEQKRGKILAPEDENEEEDES
jgi:hypothetical protein